MNIIKIPNICKSSTIHIFQIYTHMYINQQLKHFPLCIYFPNIFTLGIPYVYIFQIYTHCKQYINHPTFKIFSRKTPWRLLARPTRTSSRISRTLTTLATRQLRTLTPWFKSIQMISLCLPIPKRKEIRVLITQYSCYLTYFLTYFPNYYHDPLNVIPYQLQSDSNWNNIYLR